jgi:hypothetical protein
MINKLFIHVSQLNFVSQAFAVFVAFFAPLSSVVHFVIFLLIIDALTSIYYQMKMATTNKKGFWNCLLIAFRVVESGKLRKTLEKLFFYVLIMIVFFIFDLIILKVMPISENTINTFSITNIATILICIVEMTSIAANVSKITGNPIFNKIVSVFKRKAEQKMEIEENEN